MSFLKGLINERKAAADDRYDSFEIEEISSIRRISEDAYLESPTWLGGDEEFVCLFIDLDKSSALSFRHNPSTMARIYDYFTQSVVDIITAAPFSADYIDIKGDGAFGIFEGKNASARALCAALTFKTFFEKVVRPKFQNQTEVMNCKMAISKDKVLVKKIGKRGDNNEVWAGRVVNNAAKLASLTKDIYAANIFLRPTDVSLLVLSDKVYEELLSKAPYTTRTCGHDFNGNETGMQADTWAAYDCTVDEAVHGDCAWYTSTRWCGECGDEYMKKILG